MVLKQERLKAFDFSRRYNGRKNGYKIEVIDNTYYSGKDGWYFMIYDTKSDYIFNSLWEHKSFDNYDDCVKSAEEYADNLKR